MATNSWRDESMFPRKDMVEKLRDKGKLKMNSKLKIREKKFNFFSHAPVYSVCWQNHHSFLGNAAIAFVIGLAVKYAVKVLFPYDQAWYNQSSFLIAFLVSHYLLNFWVRKIENNEKVLEHLPSSDSLSEFLDKFGKTWQQKIWKNAVKIITFGKVTTKAWTIEYGLLVSACDLSQKNPAVLKEAVKKAKNKKELRWLAGIN